MPCLFSQRKIMLLLLLFFFFSFNTQDLGKVREVKKNEEDKMCLARRLGRPLGWPWFQKINYTVWAHHKRPCCFWPEALGNQDLEILVKCLPGVLSSWWDLKVNIITFYLSDYTLQPEASLASCCLSKHGPGHLSELAKWRWQVLCISSCLWFWELGEWGF